MTYAPLLGMERRARAVHRFCTALDPDTQPKVGAESRLILLVLATADAYCATAQAVSEVTGLRVDLVEAHLSYLQADPHKAVSSDTAYGKVWWEIAHVFTTKWAGR